jgi:hypothetical protein
MATVIWCWIAVPNRRQIAYLAMAGLLVTVIILPWLYLMTVHPPGASAIAGSFGLQRFAGLDEIGLRLLPFPISRMPLKWGHPYFVTQANVASILVTAILVCYGWQARSPGWIRPAAATLAFLLASLVLLIISVDDYFDDMLPRFITASQFAYRLVHPINALFLLCLITSLMTTGSSTIGRRTVFSVWLIAAIAGTGVLCSLVSVGNSIVFTSLAPSDGAMGFRIRQSIPYLKIRPTRDELARFDLSNGCSYAQMPAESSSIRCTTAEWTDIRIDPITGAPVANKAATEALAKPNRWITTNVVYYPWNALYIRDHLIQCSGLHYFCRFQTSENWHAVRYVLLPERSYVLLDRVSVVLFASILLMCGWLSSGSAHQRWRYGPANVSGY